MALLRFYGGIASIFSMYLILHRYRDCCFHRHRVRIEVDFSV
jgi:hypothetical protein